MGTEKRGTMKEESPEVKADWAWWAAQSPQGAARAREELARWQDELKDGLYQPLPPSAHPKRGGRRKKAPTE
jgi:hypothetical protein